jgi:hypothetical protein
MGIPEKVVSLVPPHWTLDGYTIYRLEKLADIFWWEKKLKENSRIERMTLYDGMTTTTQTKYRKSPFFFLFRS